VNFSNRTGLVGFILFVSALTTPATTRAAEGSPVKIEERINRLSSLWQERMGQLPEESLGDPELLSLGWADGRGRGWVNGRVGGWGDGRGSGFVNTRPWRNGWADGGFVNYRPGWLNRGGFVNARPGGSFFNRR
jgi:rSAM-associated Gly-rich repeat protein